MDIKRKRGLLIVVGAVAMASIAGGAVSLAVFTDTATVQSTFTAGTITLDATKISALDLTLANNWVPGDQVTGAVDVKNTGTNTLRYSLNTGTTSVAGPGGGVLNAALVIEVRTVDVTTPLVKCDNFDGTVLHAAGVLTASNIMFGDPSPTVGTGDRTVTAGSTDILCIRVSLPIATGNTYQGAVATSTFTFNAEQTQNN